MRWSLRVRGALFLVWTVGQALKGGASLGYFDSLWDKGTGKVWVTWSEFRLSLPLLGSYAHSTEPKLMVKSCLSGVQLPKARGPAWMIPEGPCSLPTFRPQQSLLMMMVMKAVRAGPGPTRGMEQPVVSSPKGQPCTKPWLHR